MREKAELRKRNKKKEKKEGEGRKSMTCFSITLLQFPGAFLCLVTAAL